MEKASLAQSRCRSPTSPHYFTVSAFKPSMIKMRLHLLRIALVATATFTFTSHSQAGDACAEGFTLCAPRGATSERSPQIGSPAFERLFVDIVFSSLPPSSERSLVASSTSLCCHSTMSCLLMSNLEIPFCYDPFTTDYYLPDGSYGTVVCIHQKSFASI